MDFLGQLTSISDDDEPTFSVAPAASEVPTAAPGLRSQPVARIDRALDVLNAPGSTGQFFESYFHSRNLGPGDLEELSPELWEELRLDSSGAEYDLYMQDLAEEEVHVLFKTLIDRQGYLRPQGPPLPGREEIPITDVPRTTLSGLEALFPELQRDIVIELLGSQNPHSCQSLRLMTYLDVMDQENVWSIVHAKDCPG